MKKFLKGLSVFFLVIIILLVVAGAALYVNFRLNKLDPADYLYKDFLLYAEIDSMEEIYSNLIDLKVLEAFLSGDDLAAIHQAVNNYKSSAVAHNPLFKHLLNIKAHAQLGLDGTPFIVLDMGYRSIITRLLPYASRFYPTEQIGLESVEKDGYTIFSYPLDGGKSLFIMFHKNLVFVSTASPSIENSLTLNQSDQSLKTVRKELKRLNKKLREPGFLSFYLQPNKLLPMLLKPNSPEWAMISKEVSFDGYALLNLSAANDKISMSFYTPTEIKTAELESFLKKRPSGESRLNALLPKDSSVFTRVRFASFYEFYSLFLHYKGAEYEDLLRKAGNATKLLMDLTLEEILQWIGSEAGVFYLSDSIEPIVFVEKSSQKQFDTFIMKLTNSLFIKEESTLQIEGVDVRQIGLPDFLKMIVDSLLEGFYEPYFLEIDEFVFFSMDPEALAKIKVDYFSKKTLKESDLYKGLSKGFSNSDTLSLYFDLEKSKPSFLDNQEIINRIMDYYPKGLLSLSIESNEIMLDLTAIPSAGRAVRLIPGYPIEVKKGDTEKSIAFWTNGSHYPSLLIPDGKRILNVNIEGEVIALQDIGEKFTILNNSLSKNFVYLYSNDGKIHKLDETLQPVEPFPVSIDISQSFTPLIEGDQIYYYSKKEKAILSINTETGETTKLEKKMPKNVLTPPAFSQNYIAVHPKDLSGMVDLIDMNTGESVPGWPVSSGGISLCGPVMVPIGSGKGILFLSQSGNLFFWNWAGDSFPGFPLELKGDYYTPPAIVKTRDGELRIAVINSDGLVTVLSPDGNVIRESELKGIRGEESRIQTAHFANGGVAPSRFIVTGSRNFIVATDTQLSPLPNFPLKGYTDPSLFDYDGDGKNEMLTVGFDGKIYLYSLLSF